MPQGRKHLPFDISRSAGDLKQWQKNKNHRLLDDNEAGIFLAETKDKLATVSNAVEWEMYWEGISALRKSYQELIGPIVFKFFDFSCRKSWRYFDLKDLTFEQAINTSPIEFYHCVFSNVRFTEALWKEVQFTNSIFKECRLRGNQFILSGVSNCKLLNTRIGGSMMEETTWVNVVMMDGGFKNNYLKRHLLQGCKFENVSFMDNHYRSNTIFLESIFKKCRFNTDKYDSTSQLKRNRFSGCYFANTVRPIAVNDTSEYDLCTGL